MKTDIDIHNHSHFSFDLWLTLIKSHPEFKAKTIKAMKNAVTPEWLQKVSAKGRKHTEETKRKISETEKLTKSRRKLCLA